MKPSLQLKFSQQLTMTPQLQQAIKLLQLSTMDLSQEIQEAIETNPLLELSDGTSTGESTTDNAGAASNDISDFPGKDEQPSLNSDDFDVESIAQDQLSINSEYSDQIDTGSSFESSELPKDLPLDHSWEDYLSASSEPAPSITSKNSADYDDYVYEGETVDDLQQHLLWQMELTYFSPVDYEIALAIIDAIDDSGFLSEPLESIWQGLNNEDIDFDEVECVLKRIQHFDPVGVGAKSLQDCLLIQLNQFPSATPHLSAAQDIILEFSELLGNKDYRTLMRKTRLSEEELKGALKLLRSLNFRPGESLRFGAVEHVIPDVSVFKKNGRWMVELNNSALPALSINEQYAALSKTAKNEADANYLKSNLQEARWFIKSIESRNETLLRVANCIVQQQVNFFEHGPEMMKPMVLNDVAELVEMHESTISRVTTQKYMHTPRGIFELKYFFSSHVATDSGGEASSTAIRALIKKLVAAENPAKPLSDNKIADLLSEQGIMVARRTIAKYRESLNIASSSQRKSLL